MGRTWWRVMVGCVTLVAVLGGEATAMTGNEYRALPPLNRLYYVVGVIDGWTNVTSTFLVFGEREPSWFLTSDIVNCLMKKGMTEGQAHAIVDKWVRENPAHWHERAADLVFLALHEACKP